MYEGVMILAILCSILGILFSIGLIYVVMRRDKGSVLMQRISSYIHEGARAFLFREYRFILIFALVVFLLLFLGLGVQRGYGYLLSFYTAISYLIGALFSVTAGYVGMEVAVRSNCRTTQGATKSFIDAFTTAFYGGSVMGLMVASLGLLGLTSLFLIFYKVIGNDILKVTSVVTGFSLGASSVALFARVGGGIYTKAADVGADLVGKVEAGIPEDDPRNPAVIADNVGDNVGDVAGMGADLYESYVGSILSAIVIAASLYLYNPYISEKAMVLAVTLPTIGLVSSILSVLITRFSAKDPQRGLMNATIFAGLFVAVLSFVVIRILYYPPYLYLAILAGLLSGIIIGAVAQYYSTGKRIREIAYAAEKGVSPNIIAGISTGMMSTVLPLIVIGLAVIVSFMAGEITWYSGFFGVALAGVSMLSVTGIAVSVDAYGPIADNAGGIAQMSGLPESVRKITDSLDAAGNTTAAIGKGFAIGSAALTALAFFSAYLKATNLSLVNLLDKYVIAGVFIGGCIPFFFSSRVMKAVGKIAEVVVEEVRRQFREIPGLLEGKAKAEYGRIVDITTKGALKEMINPGIVAFISPILCGVLLGPDALAGFLLGALITGVPLALFMANSGAAWDNAKKWIEEGNLGGKGSKAHKASVEGDTVGDPFKDSAGPSLNILLKLMSVVSLVFAPLILYLYNILTF